MKGYVTMGLTVLAGAALFEAALIPGVLIGGAAILAPRYLPRLVPGLQRPPRSRNGAARQPVQPVAGLPARTGAGAGPAAGLGLKRAIAKTITFRLIVTTLDFSTNYVVLGSFSAAAGLSAFALVAGPIFYLSHEAAWNYFGPEGTAVDVPVPNADSDERRWFTMSRALAKTVTFRTLATALDFTTNYVVVGDLATAAGLSAFAFVVGPFVYYGHEKAWDYFTAPADVAAAPPRPIALLPAPV